MNNNVAKTNESTMQSRHQIQKPRCQRLKRSTVAKKVKPKTKTKHHYHYHRLVQFVDGSNVGFSPCFISFCSQSNFFLFSSLVKGKGEVDIHDVGCIPAASVFIELSSDVRRCISR
jgi:hypothetical protein